ncbi:MAG: MurR/RpiR family transcriptional regulator [Mangrovicoccus sp.]|nr:MurR/RpiR family transcriptional regulator [Mangrovicoccus sp.]
MGSSLFEDRIASHYNDLSDRLRRAADHVLANPVDVATRSLRSIAEESGLAPASYTRLAQALGYAGYEALREELRGAVGQRYARFSDKAKALQEDLARETAPAFLHQHSEAVIANLAMLTRDLDPERLERLVNDLQHARQVAVSGGLSSQFLAHHMVYLARYFSGQWRVCGSQGQNAAAALSDLGREDLFLLFTLRPFAACSIRLAEAAHKQGLRLAVITDTHSCPALAVADHGIVVPTETPQFFSSHAAVVSVLETIIGMLVARAGKTAQERIAQVADLNHDLGEYWEKP